MTSRQISHQIHEEIAARTAARSRDLGYIVREASDPVIARMDRIERLGDYDRTDDGLIHNWQDLVGGDHHISQVKSLEGELLVSF